MRIFLMLLITFLVNICSAQSPRFAIKGGINLSTIDYKNSGNSGTKIAYHAGIFSRFQFSTNWSFQSEAFYSKQGVNQTVSGENYLINLDYINIPLLVQLLIKTGLRLEAGPQVGYLLSAKNIYQNVERKIKSNYRSFDFSFPIGVSYEWPSGFGIDGRWVPGLNNIQISYGDGRNSVIQVGLFYKISKSDKYK